MDFPILDLTIGLLGIWGLGAGLDWTRLSINNGQFTILPYLDYYYTLHLDHFFTFTRSLQEMIDVNIFQ